MAASVNERAFGRLRPWLIALAVTLALLGAYAFRFILLVGIVGMIGGTVLAPVIGWLQRRARLPRSVSLMLTALLLAGVAAGVGVLVGGLVDEQSERLTAQGPEMVRQWREQAVAWVERFGGFGAVLQQVDWAGLAERSATAVLGGAKTGAEALGALIVVLAIALFTGGNPEGYLRGLLSLFPPRARPEVERLARGSATVVRQWLGCQCVVVLISGLLTAVVLGLIGFDYWLVVALLTVVLDFIPLFGALITGGVAVLLTLGTEPEKVWWVLLAYVVLQQLETDVTLPLVMKGRIRLPEAPLLLFVLMMGAAFGIAGVFVAPPVFAVLHHLYVRAYVPRIERRPARPVVVGSRVPPAEP